MGVVLFWNLVLDWLSDRFPFARKLLREPPRRLIKDGRVLRNSLRKEILTEEELLAQLRKEGITDVSRVREAYLEADGQVSVVQAPVPQTGKRDQEATPARRGKKRRNNKR